MCRDVSGILGPWDGPTSLWLSSQHSSRDPEVNIVTNMQSIVKVNVVTMINESWGLVFQRLFRQDVNFEISASYILWGKKGLNNGNI